MNAANNFAEFFASLEPRVLSLIDGLEMSGYQFADRASAILPPHPDTESFIQLFQANALPLPRALQEFYRRFGGINLSGRYPQWPDTAYPDPLWIDPLESGVDELRSEFLSSEEGRTWYEECYGGFYLVIAPDYYHKENVSGGKPYGILLPSCSDNPSLSRLPWELRFTEYLEFAVSKGGFPGLGELK